MLEESTCLVGVASSLVVQHDMVNYRWLFYSPEESLSLVIARAPLLQHVGTTAPPSHPSYTQVQVIHLPSTPQSIALHRSTCRISIACVDGTALLFSPEKSSPGAFTDVLCDDASLVWHTQATWRCEPGMTTPLKWCESKEDVWLVGAATKVSIWKVVDDAVSVYSNRSFDLGSAVAPLSAVLFDTCSTGRFVATTTSPHARVVKIWSLNTWTMEMTAPFCVFLGHARALRSIEWLRPEARGALDNATIMTLDVSGTLTLWREDSNASTFGFLRVWVLDDCPIRVCGAISRRKTTPKTLLWEFPTDSTSNSMKVWQTAVADKTHHLYTHTMDRVHTKSSKALGFSFRAGTTADTHEGEKFIQGNLALSKCSITYLVYLILDDGELRVWRVDCTMFLTSTPRVTLVCTASDLRAELRRAVPLQASVVNFIPTTNPTAQPLDVSMTLLGPHDLDGLRVSVVLPPPPPTLSAGIASKATKPPETKVSVHCAWTPHLVHATATHLHGIKRICASPTHDTALVVRDGSHHAMAYDAATPHNSNFPLLPSPSHDHIEHDTAVVAAVAMAAAAGDSIFFSLTASSSSAAALSCVRYQDRKTRHAVVDSTILVDDIDPHACDGAALLPWEGTLLVCAKEDAALGTSSTVVRLVAITRRGEFFLWRVEVPDDATQPPRAVGIAACRQVLPEQAPLHASFVGDSGGCLFFTVGTGTATTDGAVLFWRFHVDDASDETRHTELSIRQSRPPLPLPPNLGHVDVDASGLMALLLPPSQSPPSGVQSPTATIQVQHMWDPSPVSRWSVDAAVQSLAWLNGTSQVVAISPTTVFGFLIDGTPSFTHNLHPGVAPTSICVPRHQANTMYLAHGAFVTQLDLPPSSVRSTVPDVWSPMNLLHLVLDGRFKAAHRVLQALVDAVTLSENQAYLDMKEAKVTLPWLPWSAVYFDKATGKDDRATFTKQHDTAANLFAPRAAVLVKPQQDKSTDFEVFFAVANDHRLRFVPEADRGLFRVVCSLLKCEADARDLPGLRFMVHLALTAETGGMCAEAMVWARLTSMDLFALPYFQNLTMEWTHVQRLRLPFWLDDVHRLKQTTEQVANREYAATKDPFAIALYYVLLGKTRLLSNLFRLGKESKIADLLSNDFTDDRWKAAAIKNAFVLKSKQRYLLAATFFLLGNKVYEAASMAESADPTFVLSFLILRLSEPSTLKQLGPTTIQFVRTVLLDKATQSNDVYMQCLCRFFLDKRLVLEPFLAQPTSTGRSERMACVFQTTSSAYWQVSAASFFGACRLVQHGWTQVDETDEPACLALHCMAATRLRAQGYGFLGHAVLSDMAQVFSSMAYLGEFPWSECLRHDLALACVSDQLVHLCALFDGAVAASLLRPFSSFEFDLSSQLDAALTFFPHVLPSQVARLVRPHSVVAWMMAAHYLVGTSEPVVAQVHVVTNAMLAPDAAPPSRVLRATLALIEYLHVMLAHEDQNVIRLATGAIYTGLFVVFPAVARRLSPCCVVRLVSLMCPQKEIIHAGSIRTAIQNDDVCLTCLDHKPRLLPSLRQDLPALHAMVTQLLVQVTPSFKPSGAPSCWYWTTLLALLHDTMEQHVLRLTDQLDIAQSLQDTWKTHYTPRTLKNDPCKCVATNQSSTVQEFDDERRMTCAWQTLIQLIVPTAAAAIVLPTAVASGEQGGPSGVDQPPHFSEVIYSSDVPGETIRGMCCNMQQKNTVVFCNGRFLYRALAKKPPKTSNLTASCQLHVNAKYTPPAVFFAGDHNDHVKAVTPSVLSPQPDSKGNGSYKPVAVQSHPDMPLFCSGTANGTVEVWRFDQTASCNVFEHHVAPAAASASPLAPLTSAPRRDIHRIRFANSGYTLGACDALGYVYLWNFASEGSAACYAHLQCHNRGTRDFAFLNASSCVASVGSSTKKKNLCLWDTLLPPHKALICAPLCHPVGAVSVVFSSRHQLVISGGESGSLSIFDVRQQRVLYAVSSAHDCAITTLALHPQGHCVLSGSASGDVKIWSLPLFRELCSWANTTNAAKTRQPSSSFLGDASSTFTTATAVTGITDAFATEDFFYASGSDGVIQRYQTPVVTSL